jgi:hypothetical protein
MPKHLTHRAVSSINYILLRWRRMQGLASHELSPILSGLLETRSTMSYILIHLVSKSVHNIYGISKLRILQLVFMHSDDRFDHGHLRESKAILMRSPGSRHFMRLGSFHALVFSVLNR